MISLKGYNPYKAISVLKNSKVVCFDVDSTISQHEGLEQFAQYNCNLSQLEFIKKITNQAMLGEINYEKSLEKRLDIIKPTQQSFSSFIQKFPIHYTKGVLGFIRFLQKSQKEIFLISGGFLEMIQPIKKELNLDDNHIFCNTLSFHDDGTYDSFDHSKLTCKNLGKLHVVKLIKERHPSDLVVMIGDGMTDVETASVVDAFIGYGGVSYRQKVEALSMLYIDDFSILQSLCEEENSKF
ncbi:hypothetical protein WA158_001050 [Blastocystis sp. Blastoise]